MDLDHRLGVVPWTVGYLYSTGAFLIPNELVILRTVIRAKGVINDINIQQIQRDFQNAKITPLKVDSNRHSRAGRGWRCLFIFQRRIWQRVDQPPVHALARWDAMAESVSRGEKAASHRGHCP